MQEFDRLPQELIYEIFKYVPEYGHRVSCELHEQSLSTIEVSAYCDFYRYCTRLRKDRVNACIIVLTEDVSEDLKVIAFRCLEGAKRKVLYEYLKQNKSVPVDILVRLGFIGIDRWTKMIMYRDIFEEDRAYKNADYYYKVVNLYSLMILRDNGFLTKKEFDDECASIDDLDINIILEIILGLYSYLYHIFNMAIRYFRSRIPVVIERVKLRQAAIDGIIGNNWYVNYEGHIEAIVVRLQVPKLVIDDGKNVLRQIRDQLMSTVKYEDYWASVDNMSLFTMIESMADEE